MDAVSTKFQPNLNVLREAHHALARAVAAGKTIGRPNWFLADPAFKQLVAFYKGAMQ